MVSEPVPAPVLPEDPAESPDAAPIPDAPPAEDPAPPAASPDSGEAK